MESRWSTTATRLRSIRSRPSRWRTLTEENRRDLARHARHEAENARIAIRNIRRDAIHHIRELVKEKEVAEDDAHRGEDEIQKLTDKRISEVDQALSAKEADLMEV